MIIEFPSRVTYLTDSGNEVTIVDSLADGGYDGNDTGIAYYIGSNDVVYQVDGACIDPAHDIVGIK
jgi:hypothetical protein